MIDRNSWRTVWVFAGSRNLSVFVLIMASTYVLVLAVFGLLVEARWLEIMAGLYPFRLLYALFFVNLIFCATAWAPAVVRRCRRELLLEPGGKAASLEHAVEVPEAGSRIESIKQRLRQRGYTIRGLEGGSAPAGLFYATRGRYSLVGNLMFHAGFLFLLAGAATNVATRFEGTAIIAEGGSFTGGKGEYRTIADAFTGALPHVDFDVAKISAEFWQGKLFFTSLEAQLVHRGGVEIARLSNAVSVGGAEVTISGFGYAPLAVLKDKDGEIVTRAYVKLNVFPPGSEDYFFLPGYPHKIFVSFYPDHATANGGNVSKSMDPVNPAYFVRIMRGRIPVYAGLLKPGAWADYDGLSISFPSFVRSGDFRIVSNPGHPLIWTAFVVMVLGLAWRLLFYRKEVALWQDEAGRTLLSGRFEYFPKLNAAWLASVVEESGSEPR